MHSFANNLAYWAERHSWLAQADDTHLVAAAVDRSYKEHMGLGSKEHMPELARRLERELEHSSVLVVDNSFALEDRTIDHTCDSTLC